ncbi:MAG: hypothetical protein GKR91_11520 [Pseudomonadales bacterium]|nr:hypothetical protein [Pseudomonadales bacterium]
MAEYMITYIGGDKPSSPEEGQAHFKKYQEWLAALGAAAVSPMNPLKGTATVNPDGSVSESGLTGMSGFTVVEADSMDAALDMAKTCPFLDINGSLEVSEMVKMST